MTLTPSLPLSTPMATTFARLFPVLASCGLSVMSLGCPGAAECVRSTDAQNRTVVACPRLDPVTLEDTPAPGACQRDADRIICAGEDGYTLEGERVDLQASQDPASSGQDSDSPAEPPDQSGGDGSAEPTPAGQERLGPASSSCQVIASQIICEDGVGASSSQIAQDAECRSETIPGVGRRIVCQRDGAPQEISVVPPTRGVDPEDIAPRCRARATEITCTDGTVYRPDPDSQEARALEEAIEEGCDAPVFAELTPQEVQTRAACQAELSCEGGDDAERSSCFERVLEGLSQECEELLTPELTCPDAPEQFFFRSETPCIGPSTGWELRLPAVRQWLKESGCRVLRADVFVRPDPDEQDIRADLLWLDAIKDIEVIEGALQITRARLPPGQDPYDEWLLLEEQLAWAVINGEVNWTDVITPNILESAPKVIGQLRISGVEDITDLRILRTLERVDGSVYISANPDLEDVEIYDDPEQRTSALEIDGVFAFTGNPSFDPCNLDTLTNWALRTARGVLIASIVEDPDFTCD